MQQRENVITRYFQAWMDKDGTVLRQTFADDAVYTESYGPEHRGLPQIERWFADWITRGVVLQWPVKRFIHQGNVAVAEWYFACDYDHTTSGFDGVTIAEFNDAGKIVSLREFQSKAEHYSPYAE